MSSKYSSSEFKKGTGRILNDNLLISVHYKISNSFDDLDKEIYIENTYESNAVQFVLGKNRLIDGVEENIRKMRVGSNWRLSIPAEMAFGGIGVPGRILPNQSIAIEIYIVSAEEF